VTYRPTITAYHEAGHAVAAVALDLRVDVVTIRPTHRYGGCTATEHRRAEWLERIEAIDVTATAIMQPADWRRDIEADILVSLAGPAAGDAVAPATRREDPDEQRAARAATALARLSPRHREVLDRLEADDEPVGADDHTAWTLASVLSGEDEAAHHLAWMQAVARRFVADYWHHIAAVAEALLEREVLSGEELLATTATLK
jgi:hypothetical protein